MNYFNPYFISYPYSTSMTNPGLFSRLFGNFNLSNVLSNTQKVLNFANQAIPLVKQVPPMMQNAKTMFKVMNEFKKVDQPISKKKNISNLEQPNENYQNNNLNNINSYGPTFFN